MAAASIEPRTRIGAVRLAVADLDRARDFYQRVVGLRAVDERAAEVAGEREGEAVGERAVEVRLGAREAPLVELVAEPEAPPRPRGTTGLFHLAILVPDRAELARSLRRIAEAGWPLAGASDHLVSEALYLADPEGNGIEIYRDRPREGWRRDGKELRMGTFPLDLESLLGEAPNGGSAPESVPPGTTMGHVHLNVGELEAGERFYAGALGFEVTVRGYPGALFLSAGGYHHHIGLNLWAGSGAPPPPPGSRGLRRFEIVLPDPDAVSALEARASEAGAALEPRDRGLWTEDPWGNGVLVRAATA